MRSFREREAAFVKEWDADPQLDFPDNSPPALLRELGFAIGEPPVAPLWPPAAPGRRPSPPGRPDPARIAIARHPTPGLKLRVP